MYHNCTYPPTYLVGSDYDEYVLVVLQRFQIIISRVQVCQTGKFDEKVLEIFPSRIFPNR